MVWPRLHNLEFAPAINLSGCQVFLIPWWPLNSFDVLMATDFLGSRFQSKKMMVLFFSFYIRSVREPKMSWARNEPWRVPSVDWSQHQISDRIPSMKKDFGSTTVKDNRLLTLIKPYYVLPVVPHWWWRFFSIGQWIIKYIGHWASNGDTPKSKSVWRCDFEWLCIFSTALPPHLKQQVLQKICLPEIW
jgi:hypothetical protein